MPHGRCQRHDVWKREGAKYEDTSPRKSFTSVGTVARMHMHKCNGGLCRCGNDGAATCGANEPPVKAGHTEPSAVPEKVVAQAAVHRGAAHPWATSHQDTRLKVNHEQNPTDVSHCEANWVLGFFISKSEAMTTLNLETKGVGPLRLQSEH